MTIFAFFISVRVKSEAVKKLIAYLVKSDLKWLRFCVESFNTAVSLFYVFFDSFQHENLSHFKSNFTKYGVSIFTTVVGYSLD